MNLYNEALSFCPELVGLYRQTRIRTRSGKEFDLGGCSTANNLVVLKNVCATFKPQRTMEIGMAFGGSCLLLAAMHRQAGTGPNRQHTAIDPFQTSLWERLGIEAVERAGLSGYVRVREELSSQALPQMVADKQEFDLVYIDGSHLFEDVFVDAYYTLRVLSPNGIVLFDDCRTRHVKKVIEFIRRNWVSLLAEIDIAPFRHDKGRELKYRAARVLGQVQITCFRRVGATSRDWSASLGEF
jgi:predicted O-methyltransferase YrrM